jgi:hypothetical protein
MQSDVCLTRSEKGTTANSVGISRDVNYWMSGFLFKKVDHRIVSGFGLEEYLQRVDTEGWVSLPRILSV